MNQEITFYYNYSAKENREVQEIRKKYLPKTESKLEELKRLDKHVQDSGMIESLCLGVGGLLVFGLGMCFSMNIIGTGGLFVFLGILLGIVGIVSMAVAYPIYRSIFSKTKAEFAPRILELTTELSQNGNSNF